MSGLLAFYLEQIKEAQSFEELDYIIEQSAYKLTNTDDYLIVYEKAMARFPRFDEV